MKLKDQTLTHIYRALKWRYIKRFGSPKAYADYLYFLRFGKKIKWDAPEDLNQWINWLAFNTDTSQWSMLADKYAVRKYVAEKGFENALVPLLAVWDKPDEITFDKLPSKFVLKINNGSGDIRIIRDKNNVDIDEIKKYFAHLYEHPFGIDTAEPHYLRIQPKIIAEQLLEDISNKNDSLIDYKFYCFNGIPKWCFICKNRTKHHFTTDLYTADSSWKRIEQGNLHYDDTRLKAATAMERPLCLDRMLEMASCLSIGHPQMRVDFYEVNGRVYFGEITMTANAGRLYSFTEQALVEMGNLCGQAYRNIQREFHSNLNG